MKHSVYNLLELKPAISLFDEHQENSPEEESKEENKEKEENKDDTFFSMKISSSIFKKLKHDRYFTNHLKSLRNNNLLSPPPEC